MEFKILGPLEVDDGGRALALGGTKQRALLALLLLHANEVVSRDRLIEELWGDERLEDASKALQVAVSRLRRTLQPDRSAGQASGLLVTRPPGYELRLERGQLDVQRFEEQAAEGRAALGGGDPALAADKLTSALAVWRGRALADLGYESFAQAEIGRLEERRSAALEDRIAADLELGRHAGLVAELQELVQRHPLRERLRDQLMLALYRSGRQADALEAYQDARVALTEELGIEPSRELRELQQAILRQDPILDLPSADRGEASTRGTPAAEGLVGREAEIDELRSQLDAVVSGNGALVLVGGEPGIGKSRLAEALAGEAEARGARVLVGRCWEAGGAPAYWPWVQVLRSYARDTEPDLLRSQVAGDGTELATIVPELRERLPDLPRAGQSESEGARFRLFDAVTSFVRRAASAQPLTVLLDDLHAADAPSLLLLRFLAAELPQSPIMIVGCYRDTEVGPGHPLAEALPELTRQGVVRRISLRGLGLPDTTRLLELTVGQAVPEELAARVHEETAGNPLFSGEVARLLAAEGRLEEPGPSGSALPIPEGVQEAIGRRLQRQTDQCRHALTLASVLGREFDLEALERVCGIQQDALFTSLEEAAAARLVGEVPGGPGRMRFSHVLMRDSIYETLPPTRRLRLHREVAEALECLYAGSLEPHVAELAHHYLAAGSAQAGKAIHYATRAGDRAAAQLAFEEAARHYQRALQLLETVGPIDELRTCELLLAFGEVLSRAGEGSEAKEAFRRAAAIAEGLGRADLLAGAALGYGGRFAWARAGSDVSLVPLLESALAAVGQEDSAARVRLLARLAAALRDEPQRDRRLRVAGEALEMARRIGDPATLAYALVGYYPAVEGPDMLVSGAVVDELVALAERTGDKELAYDGHDHRLHRAWALADRAGVDVALAALERFADELRQPAHRWHLGSTRMVLALMEGRFEDADELISGSLVLGRRAESWNASVTQRVGLFVLRREQGRLAELGDTIPRSVREYPALLRFRCALTHQYAELERTSEARAALDEVLSRDLASEYLDAEWLFSMSLLPSVCAFLEDAGAARRLYDVLLPYGAHYAEAPLEGIFGAAARGLGVLATTLERYDDAERHLEAAIETERQMRALPWLAHAQHDLAAVLLLRNGQADQERAAELLAGAVGTYRELGMELWARRAASLAAADRPN